MESKELVGSGPKIVRLAMPFLVIGIVLNVAYPSVFSVGGPSIALTAVSIAILLPGVAIWIWSAALIKKRVPRGELITNGPFSVFKHPLYTSVALFVIPWIGVLLDTWLGALIGAVFYAGSRVYSPEEERDLSTTFGARWDEYCNRVKVPWI